MLPKLQKKKKLRKSFVVTPSGINLQSTVSVAQAKSTRPEFFLPIYTEYKKMYYKPWNTENTVWFMFLFSKQAPQYEG